jgi:hypothetical protein
LGDRGLLETKYSFGDRAQSYTGGVFAEALVQVLIDRFINHTFIRSHDFNNTSDRISKQ